MHTYSPRLRTLATGALAVLAVTTAVSCAGTTRSTDVGNATSTSAATTTTAASATPERLAAELQRILDQDSDRMPSSPGQIMHVIAPDAPLDATFASGNIDLDGPALTGSETVRIASITKTFVAVAVLRLAEESALTLDQPIDATGLPVPILDVLRQDGYQTDSITIEHLLRHTSGIADFAGNDEGIGASAYSQAIASDPTHQWTALEQITFAVDHADPLAAPGDEFHYSDTNYVLLGQVIEATTGTTLASSLRELLRFDELGLNATYMETVEPVPANAVVRAAQYIGEQSLNDLSASIDLFGGGGLVSSMRDVATFFHKLFAGEIFADPKYLEAMTSLDDRTGSTAGLGLFPASTGAIDCWYHDGLWGLLALTCPEIDLTITRTWNQATPEAGFDPNGVVVETLQALSSYITENGDD